MLNIFVMLWMLQNGLNKYTHQEAYQRENLLGKFDVFLAKLARRKSGKGELKITFFYVSKICAEGCFSIFRKKYLYYTNKTQFCIDNYIVSETRANKSKLWTHYCALNIWKAVQTNAHQFELPNVMSSVSLKHISEMFTLLHAASKFPQYLWEIFINVCLSYMKVSDVTWTVVGHFI